MRYGVSAGAFSNIDDEYEFDEDDNDLDDDLTDDGEDVDGC